MKFTTLITTLTTTSTTILAYSIPPRNADITPLHHRQQQETLQQTPKDSSKKCTFRSTHLQYCNASTPPRTSYIQIRTISLPPPPSAPQHARFVNVAAQRPGNENGYVKLENSRDVEEGYEIQGVGDLEEDEAPLRVWAEGDEMRFEYKGEVWGTGEEEREDYWCKSGVWDQTYGRLQLLLWIMMDWIPPLALTRARDH
ncbi:hypothetical protein BU24DRAFT_495458 [Aaosphaeria arxii CBS 175.79]|uniref:Uncharacterized protein n=1 Tax=Aaosphaeria arxii CBS 175.79 TaxID=1450172 RepID=A0A6A5XDL7_9PLEO|nr:uncharacterized protein BU24DRAFT_495458 [Aaosphaeria arxii CBS 175.79]KAF2011235.1 hypothetical protein BU24DRAFT_495458 [Aaosphaeria arxii CBS 175.79]